MFTLSYEPGMWDDEVIYEEFETVKELLERYEEIQYDTYEIRAFNKTGEEFEPWFEKG